MKATKALKGLMKPRTTVRRLLRGLIQYETYVVRETDNSSPIEAKPLLLDVEFRPATLEDIPRMVDAAGHSFTGSESERLRHLLSGPNHCLMALHEGHVVACSWRMFEYADFAGVSFKMGPGWVYSHMVYTVAPYRRKGIQENMQALHREYARSMGARKSVYFTVSTNTPARRAFAKALPRDIARFRGFVVLGKWRFVLFPRWLKRYLAKPAPEAAEVPESQELTDVRA